MLSLQVSPVLDVFREEDVKPSKSKLKVIPRECTELQNTLKICYKAIQTQFLHVLNSLGNFVPGIRLRFDFYFKFEIVNGYQLELFRDSVDRKFRDVSNGVNLLFEAKVNKSSLTETSNQNEKVESILAFEPPNCFELFKPSNPTLESIKKAAQKKKANKIIDKDCLKEWLRESNSIVYTILQNLDTEKPYPTENEKRKFVEQSGLSYEQVSSWY